MSYGYSRHLQLYILKQVVVSFTRVFMQSLP